MTHRSWADLTRRLVDPLPVSHPVLVTGLGIVFSFPGRPRQIALVLLDGSPDRLPRLAHQSNFG
jgi:hypothetical protein